MAWREMLHGIAVSLARRSAARTARRARPATEYQSGTAAVRAQILDVSARLVGARESRLLRGARLADRFHVISRGRENRDLGCSLPINKHLPRYDD